MTKTATYSRTYPGTSSVSSAHWSSTWCSRRTCPSTSSNWRTWGPYCRWQNQVLTSPKQCHWCCIAVIYHIQLRYIPTCTFCFEELFPQVRNHPSLHLNWTLHWRCSIIFSEPDFYLFQRWDLHHRWTMSLLDEFFLQGDKERELGLPFSPLCDRNNTLVAESQIGFIDFIVEPSMGVCADMLECILGPLHSSSKNSTSTSGQEPINEDGTGIVFILLRCN